jgi:DNA-directed RNA polymerase subunit alpha
MAQAIELKGLVRPQLVEMKKREDSPNATEREHQLNKNSAEFNLQPLERGFGHTLGNAMRRMLLSSLRGSAVWGIRIDGVLHEHQTIPGVVEDVHQIIGNLKMLTLILDEGVEEIILRISKGESGPVTAADIQAAPGVTVLDPSHHLFTMQDDRDINVELYVNKGRGYVEADQHTIDRALPVDVVRIDSIYNPVRRANFAVAETRVGQRTDYDRLTLNVETNGTISPEEAVSYAAALAQTHAGDGQRMADLLRTPIDDFELSVRSVNSLKNSNIRTLGDLVKMSESQILQVKNFGKKSLNEIADLLEKHDLNIGMKYEDSVDGIRFTDRGTPPNRNVATVAADEDEEG